MSEEPKDDVCWRCSASKYRTMWTDLLAFVATIYIYLSIANLLITSFFDRVDQAISLYRKE